MHKSIWQGMFGVTVLSAGLFLSACSGGGGASGSASTTSTTSTASSTAAAIVLSASQSSVRSDNLDSTTLTAAVVDKDNIAISGAKVNFAKTSGQLGVSSGTSGTDGKVTIAFSSGTDRSNRTDVITATVVGTSITAQIPVKVVGSTLAITTTQSGSGGAVTVNAIAKDAAGNAVSGQDIRFSLDTSGCTGTVMCGSGTLSASSTSTDSNGAAQVRLTPTASGTVTIKAEWYSSSGTSTYTATTAVSVAAESLSFAVTTPADNYTAVSLGSSQGVTVSVPTTISGNRVASIRLATTLGTWSNGSKIVSVTPVANAASETLTAGNSAGNANIQIDALSASGTVLATINRVFALSAPASQAATITLQPSVSNVAPSSGGTTNTVTLTATVRTATSGSSPANAVGGAPVLFEIMNSTGSGEQITPTLQFTDSNGQAKATFTSGAQPTIGALKLKASLVGLATPTCDNLATPAVGSGCDVKAIYVGGAAVSVSLGQASVIRSVNNDTNYELPMSVLVVDNSGAAVPNIQVSLSAFPNGYYTGYRGAKCAVQYVGNSYDGQAYHRDEDVNENDILDPGEDVNHYIDTSRGAIYDGLITPPHSSAGALPSTVTTDASGVATFSLVYQKQYASWVNTRIRAKVVLATGTTESTNQLSFDLPISAADANDPCPLPPSPFNTSWGMSAN